METTHLVLNVLGWVFLLGSWAIYFFNKKKEMRLYWIQLAANVIALICFATNLILKFT
jgi:hypothetical protein